MSFDLNASLRRIDQHHKAFTAQQDAARRIRGAYEDMQRENAAAKTGA